MSNIESKKSMSLSYFVKMKDILYAPADQAKKKKCVSGNALKILSRVGTHIFSRKKI